MKFLIIPILLICTLGHAAETNKVVNVKIDARLTIITTLVYESEAVTTRGSPMERKAMYKLVDLYVVKNTYNKRTWYTTNAVDTGLSVVRREVRGDAPNEWIAVPNL